MPVKVEKDTSRPEGAGNDNDALDPEGWLAAHGDYLFRYALMRVSSREIAEDLVQETFITAINVRGGFEGRSSVRTWLCGILKNKLLEHLRKQMRLAKHEEVSGDDELLNRNFDRLGLWNVHLGSWAGRPDERFEQKEFFGQLEQCLGKLKERTRLAFVLHTVDQLESRDICSNLGVSQENLWIMLHRARLSLRECIEKNWVKRRAA